MSLEEKLAKIKSPNLQSQQHTAIVLTSIEETLHEQKTKLTPTAYFAALLALLKQSTDASQNVAGDAVLVAAVYLLDLVTSHVPASLLRSQFASIVTLLTPILNASGGSDTGNSALLRSTTGCLESMLIAQDAAAWSLPQSQTGPRQAIAILLTLAIDPRPKVRKRAQAVLSTVLRSPPPGPAIDHPAAEFCATAAQNNLTNAIENVEQVGRRRGPATDESHEPAVLHALQLIKTIAAATGGWPSRKIESLCELLLSISRSRNEFVVMGAFEVFEVIFDGMTDPVSSSKLPRILDAIVELKPTVNDSQVAPPWIAVLSRGYGTAATVDPQQTFAKVPELFDVVTPFLASPSHNTRASSSECLISFLVNCVPVTVVSEPSIYDEKVFGQIAQKALGLLAVKYNSAWAEVSRTLSAVFDALRWRGDPSLLPILKSVAELRATEAFQGKKEADDVLGHAINSLGPRRVLRALPLNLVDPLPHQPGRAWLLPLLRDHVSNTDLSHFRTDLVPLSEEMYRRVNDHAGMEKTFDMKIFETVAQQVWAIFPAYCDLPLDLAAVFDQDFAELLANHLYQHPDLRVDLCRGMQNLVESNQAILASNLSDEVLLVERRLCRADAERNIGHLTHFASNILAVLFNVYSQTLPQSRAFILQCIDSYLSITPEKDLVETFDRVSAMLADALPKDDGPAPKPEPAQQGAGKLPPTSHTLLDLVIALSVHLPRSTFGALFSISSTILTNPVILKSDQQIIKKAYKLIPRLATSATGAEALSTRNQELQQLMLRTSETTPVPARRDRLLAIETLVSFLPVSDLHFIPSILSEVVLGCKESNEKARTAGFDLLIAVTNKIADPDHPSGTVIRNRLVPHMPDNSPDAPATLEEVFTMVSAGLAGVSPHMVAASVIALSRLLFEYHARLMEATKEELVDTVALFLQSNNREIVRAVLGFVKVIVVVLPEETLEPRLPSIVQGLMVWSKENKGRLRAKVKGILDRCLRRFGSSKVEAWVGGDDRKMVVNLRKQRERARRKKRGDPANGHDGDSDSPGPQQFDNEFDEAVYGSDDDDSEIEGGEGDHDVDGEDDMRDLLSKKSDAHAKPRRAQYIRQDVDEDEPLDLLDPKSMANISSRKIERLRDSRARQRKATSKVNEDGKLVFNDMDNDGDAPLHGAGSEPRQDNDTSINAYLDAVSGADAVRRGQKGRLKVKSGMQKKAKQDVSQREKEDGALDGMDIDAKDATQVATHLHHRQAGKGPNRVAKRDAKHERRGLGVQKRSLPGSSPKQRSWGGLANRHGVAKRGRPGDGRRAPLRGARRV